MLRPEPEKYEKETQISCSGIIVSYSKGTVEDQRLHGRTQENSPWPRLLAGGIRVSGKHQTDVRATL